MSMTSWRSPIAYTNSRCDDVPAASWTRLLAASRAKIGTTRDRPSRLGDDPADNTRCAFQEGDPAVAVRKNKVGLGESVVKHEFEYVPGTTMHLPTGTGHYTRNPDYFENLHLVGIFVGVPDMNKETTGYVPL